MAILHVLVDAKGAVVGTAHVNPTAAKGVPQAALVAREGQRIVVLTVADEMTQLDPQSLHKLLEQEHLERPQASRRVRSPNSRGAR